MNATGRRNFKKWLRKLPDVKTMTRDALEGASRRDWYSHAHLVINETAPENPALFAHILASTSPQQTVALNWRMALAVYRAHLAGEKLSFHRLHQLTHLKARVLNTRRALAGERLKGNKVGAFARNLSGDYDAVTIDTWMLAYAGLANAQGLARGSGYEAYVHRIKRVAKRLGWHPAEVQASIWCVAYSRGNECTLDEVPYFGVQEKVTTL